MDIADNIARVNHRIGEACRRAGRDPLEVKLIAVTKTVEIDRIRQAIQQGLRSFGENYVQEALPKIEQLDRDLEWHFIGRLQSNKVKYVVNTFHLIHSVDRSSLVREINRRAPQERRVPILLQVDLAGEQTKSGVPPANLQQFLMETLDQPHLQVQGLMTMPPFFDELERARPYFRALRRWRDRLREFVTPPHTLKELSMGMTGDFEVAIEEGATMVRIGTAIFGPRPPKATG
jgi:pyridoxal phosphate enzyme (YggS family)